jgi:hypothetical protein
MVHAPDGSLHFKQKRCVVAFVFLQLSASICNNSVLAIWVNLSEDGPQAPWLLVMSQAGIGDDSIGPVPLGVVDDGLGAEVTLQFLESLQDIKWELTAFSRAIFFVKHVRSEVSKAKF